MVSFTEDDLVIATTMQPGRAYICTFDGPSELVGKTFTVTAISPHVADDPDEVDLLNVELVVDGTPTTAVFAPGDCLILLTN